MHLLIVFDHRYEIDQNGRARSPTHYNEELFEHRYLKVFNSLTVLGRASGGQAGRFRIGERVELVSAGDGKGAFSVPTWLRCVRNIVLENIARGAAVVLISPSRNASAAYRVLRQTGYPFGAEVIGDPSDSLGAGSYSHPLRSLMRFIACRYQASLCRDAVATAYVTKNALQKRYPPNRNRPTTHYSSIELDPRSFTESLPVPPESGAFRLIHVGGMAHPYKGQDTLIEAVKILRSKGVDVEAAFVGDGNLRASLEKSGEDLGIRRHLVFHGQVPAGAQVRALLDESHVFVLPSRTEGLPRSMLEAMARGLPCIGTPVGGIGELISPECIVPVGNASSVAKIVETLTKNFEFFRSESARNLQRSLEYRSEILMERRLQFYDSVQSSTLRKRAS